MSEGREARGESKVREEGGTESVRSGIQGFGESRNEGCRVGNQRAQKLGTWTTGWVSRRQGGQGPWNQVELRDSRRTCKALPTS